MTARLVPRITKFNLEFKSNVVVLRNKANLAHLAIPKIYLFCSSDKYLATHLSMTSTHKHDPKPQVSF